MNAERKENRYIRVQDDSGNMIFCPLDERDGNTPSLRDGNAPSLVDAEDCVESEVVGRYAGRLKIVDAAT